MDRALHTVGETLQFIREADRLRITEAEIAAIIDYLAEHPLAGEEVQGSGGVRKFRVARRGKGKSGGYRVIAAYLGEHNPVYLLAILSKGERANFSDEEVVAFKRLTGELKRSLRGARR